MASHFITTPLSYTVGQPVEFDLSNNLISDGGDPNVTYNLDTGQLPDGVTQEYIDSPIFKGIPTTVEQQSLTFSYSNSAGDTVTNTLIIDVVAATGLPVPQIAGWFSGNIDCISAVAPTWTGIPDTFSVEITDTANKSIDMIGLYLASTGGAVIESVALSSGALPASFTLNTTTGFITGFQGEPVVNTFPFTLTATNSADESLPSQTFTFNIWQAAGVETTLDSADASDGSNELFINYSESTSTVLDTTYLLGLSVTLNTVPVTGLTYISGAGSKRHRYSISETFSAGNTLGVSYDNAVGDLTGDVSNTEVTNNTVSFTVQASSGFVGTTLDFNNGVAGQLAQGSGAWSQAFTLSQFSQDIVPFEGVNCCKCSIVQGTSGSSEWGGIKTIPNVFANEEFWVQLRVWHPAGFDFTNTGVGVKHLRVRMRRADNTHIGYADLLLKSGGITAGFETSEFRTKYDNVNTQNLGPSIVRGRWNTYEIYIDAKETANGVIRWWANGELLFTGDGVKTIPYPGAKFDAFYFLTYWNGDAPVSQSLYCDLVRYTKTTPPGRDAAGNPMIGTGV